ncbi:MAG: ABC transporter substrate-binding protein [Candidatus Rifleibacteriota bacterium]
MLDQTKRSFVLILVGIFFMLGCGNEAEVKDSAKPGGPSYGGTYRRAFADSYIILDPAIIKDSNSHEVCRQIYDGLVEFDEKAKPAPAIAESWTISEDKLVYTFKLRNDVKFHAFSNGKPTKNGGRKLVADDVLYTFKRLLKPSEDSQGSFFLVIKGAADFAAGKTSELTGIKVLADDEIQFELEKPFAPFVSLLGMCNAFIVPHEDAEGEGSDLKITPVGTGPFLWAGKEGENLILTTNPEHFRGRPFLDKIEFLVIQDEAARFKAFKEGKLSCVDVPDSEYKNIKQNGKMAGNLLETSRWGTNYLGMNINKHPFDNKLVRQALNCAIDRGAIVKLVLNDRARVAHGVLPPGITGFDPNLVAYPYDVNRARELLARAGYPDGKGFPEIVLQYNKDVIHTRIGEFVLANLNDIGIRCRVEELDFGTHLKKVESGEAAFFRMGWTVDYPDPDSFLYTLFHSSNIGTGYNFTGLKLKELDEILDKARFETESKRRISLYRQAEKLIVEEAPWVFLYFYTTHLLHQPEVKGIKLGPMGQPFINYRDIWIEQK